MLTKLFVICIYICIDSNILYLFIIPKMDYINEIKEMIFEKKNANLVGIAIERKWEIYYLHYRVVKEYHESNA